MSDVYLLPLYARNGNVRAYTQVDADAAEDLSRWRWSLHTEDYAYRQERVGPGRGKKRAVMMHRYLLGLEEGDRRQADHINRDRLDNRRANLRLCTSAGNAQNQASRGGASRFRGVSRQYDKWAAAVVLDGRRHALGVYPTEAEAARAASAFRASHMPFSSDALRQETSLV